MGVMARSKACNRSAAFWNEPAFSIQVALGRSTVAASVKRLGSVSMSTKGFEAIASAHSGVTQSLG